MAAKSEVRGQDTWGIECRWASHTAAAEGGDQGGPHSGSQPVSQAVRGLGRALHITACKYVDVAIAIVSSGPAAGPVGTTIQPH
jgi:hypothetical protein